jgi:penicillin-binding protein 1C
VGAEAAAPLFFRIADALHLQQPDVVINPASPPPGVSRVEVCAESGDLPNKYCPQTVQTWYIPGKSPIRVSQLHRAVTLDIRTGLPACPPYDPNATTQVVFEFWPSDMMRLFREAGIPRRKAPPMPDCAVDDSRGFPTITTPLRGVTYTLRPESGDTIPLEASTDADVENVFWFDGAALIAKSPVAHGAVPWAPATDGIHLMRVIDDHGRTAERDVMVRFTE